MMFVATPVRNPVITDTETNRVKRPSLKMPAAIMNAPASTASTNNASERCYEAIELSVDPAASADAVVVVMTIRRVLAARPPPIGPAMLA